MKERFDRGKSILNPMTKRKLSAFSSNVKAVTVRMKDQLVQVKEEHKQISRFLIVWRNLEEYKFSVAPDPYVPNGQLYKSANKAVVLNGTEALTNKSQEIVNSCNLIPK